MTRKFICSIVTIFSLFLSLTVPAYANENYKAPDTIKTQEQFWEFSNQFNFNGDPIQLNLFLKANQALLQSLYDGFVDVGYTMSLAIQTEEVRQGAKIEGKKLKQIFIPIRIKTYSKGNVPFGKEISIRDFALVPKNLEPGKEMFAIHTFPDTFNFLDEPAPFYNALIDNWKEYYIFIGFTLPVDLDEKNMNLRIYDGNDFIDLNISK